jgi:uronate dehydrogenase
MFVRPTGMNPAASMRATTGALAFASGALASTAEPAGVGSPAMSNRSFNAIGIPAYGPGVRPAPRSKSAASAMARAWSAWTLMKARAPSPVESAILARLSSISDRLVIVPSARAWASSSILRMMPPTANPQEHAMTNAPAKPIMITGASGALGRVLVKALGALGWRLVLTDIAPFPDPLPAGAQFIKADLSDGVTILRLAEGCGTIIHLGGVSVERPFEEVIGPNIRGLYHIYEAARREKARVIFASSNHSVGFHERGESLPADTQFLPDGYYGLSKAYGELMGRMYWFKHGVETVNVRIGSATAEPVNARMLASWLSYGDFSRLMERCVLTPEVGNVVIWGASNNTRMTWWRDDSRAALGWTPVDSADPFAGQLAGAVSGDPVEERYMGGAYCSIEYSRSAPAPVWGED